MTPIPIPQLSIIVPCYNEEEVLKISADRLAAVLKELIAAEQIQASSYICFVNDGSTDATWNIVMRLINKSNLYRGINLSRNFGHQGALLAGLFTAKADAYVSIDADLQDDEVKIKEMVQMYLDGKDIVYGCRDDRQSDTFFKRATAEIFYKMRAFLGCATIKNHADFRLISAKAVNALRDYREVNLYLRGIIPMLGFSSGKVFYARRARGNGVSKYPFAKMLRLALDGVVNFSDIPLKACFIASACCFMLCICVMIWSFVQWCNSSTIPGWASLVMVICFFGCFQFMFLGIIGLYIGKILNESKQRPRFIITDNLVNTNQ